MAATGNTSAGKCSGITDFENTWANPSKWEPTLGVTRAIGKCLLGLTKTIIIHKTNLFSNQILPNSGLLQQSHAIAPTGTTAEQGPTHGDGSDHTPSGNRPKKGIQRYRKIPGLSNLWQSIRRTLLQV